MAVALAATLLAGCGGSAGGSGELSGARFDARRAFADLRAQVRIGPRSAGSRGAAREVRFIERRLRGAGVDEIRLQRPYRNLVARIPGAEAGSVVVGAHYDTKDIPGFVGANDGASGVAVLLELARALPRHLDGPSIYFAFFDAEESPRGESFDRGGDRGSRQFVRLARRGGGQGSPPLHRIRAMVLFDMVGDCALGVPREANSSPGLYGTFARAGAEAGSSSPFVGQGPGVLDDHTPFIEAGVPAVDLIDFDYGPGPTPGAWWHTRQDDLRHVCASSLDAVGAPALAALPAVR
ncbi:MAG TPA: M28 family peptidase [Solirubrobacterales bacterium]|nr:M28 family peptidase [Solirubrobacterales bacterium]